MAPSAPWPAGTVVRTLGTVDERYGARTLRVTLAQVADMGMGPLPAPLSLATGAVAEGAEGRRVSVTGTTVGSPTAYADGTGVLVDDGSGAVRVIVSPDALPVSSLPAGIRVAAIGPVGQRDSTGTGLGGYRIHATVAGDLVILPAGPEPTAPSSSGPPSPSSAPSPLPSISPTPSATPGPSLTPTPTPAPTPSPSPTPGPTLLAIAEARRQPPGSTVAVGGIVTAEAGRLGTPALLAIQDHSGGLVLHLDDGMRPPPRGTRVEARGLLAAPYGQLELKVASDGLRLLGSELPPTALVVAASAVDETVEALLVAVDGTVASTPSRSTSHDIAFDLMDAAGQRLRVMADASSGLATTAVRAGQSYRLTGIAGQRATRKGALDGYRLWLRDVGDIAVLAASSSGGPAAAAPGAIPIAAALAMPDATVTVEGTVTGPATLLDATGRRIVIQDATGAVEVLLPVGAVAPGVGAGVAVQGQVGRAYGAPRLRAGTGANAVVLLAGRSSIEPETVVGPPGPSLEWRLARATGRVATVTRLGSRWRAELEVAGQSILVDGLPGSGIPSTVLVAGRVATVAGIVRRAYPGATDQRFSLLPRSTADLRVESGAGSGASMAGAGLPGSAGPAITSGATIGDGGGAPAADVDLATLGEHAGERVRVGGLVVDSLIDGFSLDDGSAVGTVRLADEAAVYRGLLEPGDAVNATGVVMSTDAGDGWLLVVSSASGLWRVGDLGEPKLVQAPAAGPPETGPAEAGQESLGGRRERRLGLGSLLPGGAGDAAGLASVALLTAVSLALTFARRRRAHRRLAARIAVRLARIAETPLDTA